MSNCVTYRDLLIVFHRIIGSRNPTLRVLQVGFLRKYSKRDSAPWRDYVSNRPKPMFFVFIFRAITLLNFRLFYLKVILSSLHLQPSKLEAGWILCFLKHCNKIIERYIKGKLLKGKFENYAFSRSLLQISPLSLGKRALDLLSCFPPFFFKFALRPTTTPSVKRTLLE